MDKVLRSATDRGFTNFYNWEGATKFMASKEYRQQDADSLVRDLDGLIEKLNSTFQQDLRDEQSRFTWFMSKSNGA